MKALRYLDLFCGMGSFHYGFRKQGWTCIGACDIDPSCRATYERHSGVRPHDDIRTLRGASLPAYDVLCAGFPCQSFSQTGLRKGFDDPRGRVLYHVFRLVRETRPPLVVLENVAGILSHDGGKTFQKILRTMQKMGYDTTWTKWLASDFGLPQLRQRVFVVAVRRNGPYSLDLARVFSVDRYKKRRTLSDFFGRPFERDFAHTIRTTGHHGKPESHFTWDWYRLRDGGSFRLTLADCLRLQGFPARYALCGSIVYRRRMVGNTIPTVFTRMLAHRLDACLTLRSSTRSRKETKSTSVR